MTPLISIWQTCHQIYLSEDSRKPTTTSWEPNKIATFSSTIFIYLLLFFYYLGQEVATYWYTSVRQYEYGQEPDCLHANVNAGDVYIYFLYIKHNSISCFCNKIAQNLLFLSFFSVLWSTPVFSLKGIFLDNLRYRSKMTKSMIWI